MASEAPPPEAPPHPNPLPPRGRGSHEGRRVRSDLPFLLCLAILGALYVFLIVAMLWADLAFIFPELRLTTPDRWLMELWDWLVQAWASLADLTVRLNTRDIRYAIWLSLLSCSVTAILSVWVAVPLGYLMSRYRFWGKGLIDATLDIPIVLPPLVIGLSLLILFQTAPGRAIETVTQKHMGFTLTYVVLPILCGSLVYGLLRLIEAILGTRLSLAITFPLPLFAVGFSVLVLLLTRLGPLLEVFAQERFGTRITYAVPSVILAQFAVACAFAVRTMRVTFDQISPREEQVAMTLGCSRSQAFWWVVVPEARRGIITAFTLAWARSLGEFGPILVFSGATRGRTEVLSTTVFLELSIGDLRAAVAVSLLMIAAAVLVLLIVRLFGAESAWAKSR